MEQENIDYLVDEKIRQRVLKRETLEILEDIIAQETISLDKKRVQIQNQPNLNLGKNFVEKKDLKRLLAKAKEEVDSFLGIEIYETPKIKHRGRFFPYMKKNVMASYYPLSETILVKLIPKKKRKDITPPALLDSLSIYREPLILYILLHEYTHFVQFKTFGLGIGGFKAFLEGYAYGLSRKLIKRISKRENDVRISFESHDEEVRDLNHIYRLFAKLISRPIPNWLQSLGLGQRVYSNYLVDFGKVLFKVAEAKNPQDNIYSQIICGNFHPLGI